MSLLEMMAAHPAAGGGWSPLDLPNLVGWWDASNAGSVHATGGLVDTWDDLSGNGYHLTAATTARPTTGTRTINSLNTFDFDGTSDKMSKTSFSLTGTAATLIVVFLPDAEGGRVISLTAGGDDYNTSNACAFLSCQSGNRGTYYSNAQVVNNGSAFSTTNPSMYVATRNGDSWTGRTNQAGITGASNAVGGFAGTKFTVGDNGNAGGESFNGRLAEIILCSTNLGTTDRDDAEGALHTKWGTP